MENKVRERKFPFMRKKWQSIHLTHRSVLFIHKHAWALIYSPGNWRNFPEGVRCRRANRVCVCVRIWSETTTSITECRWPLTPRTTFLLLLILLKFIIVNWFICRQWMTEGTHASVLPWNTKTHTVTIKPTKKTKENIWGWTKENLNTRGRLMPWSECQP